jgi:hypothetical protein
MPKPSNNQQQQQNKKMEYRKVTFDVTEVAPDAPAGEWQATIPRGKCKVQPTKEERFPMIIVPIRLEKTEEEGAEYQKAIGAELSVFLVFGGKTPKGENMSKLRIRQLCEAADVDLDVIPKDIDDPDNDLDPLIRALEGKKFTCWTKVTTRKDTGELSTEVVFRDPNQSIKRDDDDDNDGDDDGDGKPRGRAKKPAPAAKGGNGRGARR